MKLLKEIYLMERLFCLIRRKATGNVTELSLKLEISERSVYRRIQDLRDIGIPVKYCNHQKTYYFEEDVKYEFRIMVGNEDLLKIKGGNQAKYKDNEGNNHM